MQVKTSCIFSMRTRYKHFIFIRALPDFNRGQRSCPQSPRRRFESSADVTCKAPDQYASRVIYVPLLRWGSAFQQQVSSSSQLGSYLMLRGREWPAFRTDGRTDALRRTHECRKFEFHGTRVACVCSSPLAVAPPPPPQPPPSPSYYPNEK